MPSVVQQVAEQGIALERAQLVLDRSQHLQPSVRRVGQRERLLDRLGFGEGQLGDGPGMGLLGGHASAADQVEDALQADEGLFVPHRGRQGRD